MQTYFPMYSNTNQAPPTFYTLQFGLLCASSFLFFMSFNMIIPELPDYLSSLGGADYKGLIIALFTVSAGLSRPFSGKLADLIGRIPVMVFGVVVCFVCSLFYPLLSTVWAFFLLRFVHGFSTGFTPTGISAIIADTVPAGRRGEAVGIWGLASNIGTAIGPALGSNLAHYVSLNAMFYTASFFSILSILILYSLKETLPERQAFALQMLRIKRSEIFEPLVFAPTLIMFLGVFSFGAILTVIPDFSKSLGVENKGIFFTFYTISSLAIRFIAGKLSDRYGRVMILKWSSLMLIFALLYIGFAQADWQLMLGACFFGMAVGMNSPTLVAWTIDLSDEQYKGRAMATMYIGMEAGIGLGALLGGYIYNNQIEKLPQVFMLSAALVLAAYLYLLWYKPKIAANTQN